MSMISPQSFIEYECKGKTYKELLEIRDRLLEEICAFENGDIDPEDIFVYPSPETVYQMDLEYLGELCRLISDRYGEEVVESLEEDEKGGTKRIAGLLTRILKFRSEGYNTTTRRLLAETGMDMEMLSDGALMDLHKALFEAAEKEGLILDMSSHDGMLEGLPYDLDFTVRRKEPGKEDLLASLTVSSQRSPWKETMIYVYGRETDNLTIDRGEDLSCDTDSRPASTFTASAADIRKIKEMCSDPVLFDNTIEEHVMPGIFVEDGNVIDITVCCEGKKAEFSFDSFWAYDGCMQSAPQTELLYRIAETVLETASVTSGTRLSLRSF